MIKKDLKVAVLGAGAMGCLFGGLLAEKGLDVALIDVWKEHVETINKNGLKGKFGNLKYNSFYSSQQNLFKPTEKFDIEFCEILNIPDPRPNKKLDESEI